MPSVLATEKAHIFIQEQINGSCAGLTSNLTTAYGLGKGWEVGLNIYGVTAQLKQGRPMLEMNHRDISQPFAPLVLVTGLKQFNLSSHWRLGIGSQNGLCPFDNDQRDHLATFSYASACYMPWKGWELHLGGYFGDKVILGGRTQPGLMGGYEIPVCNRFHLMGDCILGQSTAAVTVLGGVLYLNPHTSLSLGGQLGSLGTHNPAGAVFELTIR